MKLLYCMLLWSTFLFSSWGRALVRNKTKCRARGNLDQALKKFLHHKGCQELEQLPREEMNTEVLNIIPEDI